MTKNLILFKIPHLNTYSIYLYELYDKKAFNLSYKDVEAAVPYTLIVPEIMQQKWNGFENQKYVQSKHVTYSFFPLLSPKKRFSYQHMNLNYVEYQDNCSIILSCSISSLLFLTCS